MPQGEHSAILLTFIKLPFVIKIFVLSIFELPLKTGFTVLGLARVQTQLFFIEVFAQGYKCFISFTTIEVLVYHTHMKIKFEEEP